MYVLFSVVPNRPTMIGDETTCATLCKMLTSSGKAASNPEGLYKVCIVISPTVNHLVSPTYIKLVLCEDFHEEHVADHFTT